LTYASFFDKIYINKLKGRLFKLKFTFVPEYRFKAFYEANKNYPAALSARMKLLYETYLLLCKGNFSRFSAYPRHYQLAQQLGFGMLLRHSVETLVIGTAFICKISTEQKTIADLLRELGASHLDRNAIHTLSKARHLSNGVAHPYLLEERALSYPDLLEYYRKTFRPFLQDHIRWMKGYRCGFFPSRMKNQTIKHLHFLEDRLDAFNLKDSFSSILLRGCLVRSLSSNG
jgi:hypothetical protein